MSTLIVNYLPSGDASHTKKILDYFVSKIEGKTSIVNLDLINEEPTLHNLESMGAYYTRNFGGQPLSKEQEKAIAPLDYFSDQVVAADTIVIAHPMHNFSLPASVKAWLDSVLQKGIAFDYGEKGPFGKFTAKKVIVLYSSGGAYAGTPYEAMDTVPAVWKANLGFVGITNYEIIAFAGTSNPAKYEESLAIAKTKIDAAIAKLY